MHRVSMLMCAKFVNATSYYWNFTKFTMSVQLATKMNRLDFEVKRSKFKVAARSNTLLWQRRFTVKDRPVYLHYIFVHFL